MDGISEQLITLYEFFCGLYGSHKGSGLKL